MILSKKFASFNSQKLLCKLKVSNYQHTEKNVWENKSRYTPSIIIIYLCHHRILIGVETALRIFRYIVLKVFFFGTSGFATSSCPYCNLNIPSIYKYLLWIFPTNVFRTSFLSLSLLTVLSFTFRNLLSRSYTYPQ